MNKAKRKKEEREPDDNKRGRQEEEIRATSPSFSSQSFEEPPDKKVGPGDVGRARSTSSVQIRHQSYALIHRSTSLTLSSACCPLTCSVSTKRDVQTKLSLYKPDF